METTYHFNTPSKSARFQKAMRNSGILTIALNANDIQIYNFENIKEELKQWVLSVAERNYHKCR